MSVLGNQNEQTDEKVFEFISGTFDSQPNVSTTLPKAQKEAIQEEKELFDHNADLEKASLRNSIFRFLLKFGVILFSVIVLVRVIHLLIPTHCYWLEKEQLQTMDTVFVSSFLGGFVAKNIMKVFGLAESK